MRRVFLKMAVGNHFWCERGLPDTICTKANSLLRVVGDTNSRFAL
jgi:hypothetical protein